jgi:hypothetical protein
VKVRGDDMVVVGMEMVISEWDQVRQNIDDGGWSLEWWKAGGMRVREWAFL